MYTRYVITKRAYEDVKDLNKATKRKLKAGIEDHMIRNDPLFDAEQMPDGSYRWRIGDFRVVFDVVSRDKIVILRFQNRSELYKNSS